jgi:hypothetical protein
VFPSPIKFIASECFYDNQEFVFEKVSMLERIEARTFSNTALKSIVISEFVEI